MKKMAIVLLFVMNIQAQQAKPVELRAMHEYYYRRSSIYNYCVIDKQEDEDCSIINEYLLLSGTLKPFYEKKLRSIRLNVKNAKQVIDKADDFIKRKKLELWLKEEEDRIRDYETRIQDCIPKIFSLVNAWPDQEDKEVQEKLEQSFDALMKKIGVKTPSFELDELARAIKNSKLEDPSLAKGLVEHF